METTPGFKADDVESLPIYTPVAPLLSPLTRTGFPLGPFVEILPVRSFLQERQTQDGATYSLTICQVPCSRCTIVLSATLMTTLSTFYPEETSYFVLLPPFVLFSVCSFPTLVSRAPSLSEHHFIHGLECAVRF
jgi:hypothetical protein